MDTVSSFLNASEDHAVKDITTQAFSIESLILDSGLAVEQALATPPGKLTLVDRDSLRQICLHEMLAGLRSNAGLETLDHEGALTVGYLADLVIDLMTGAPGDSPRKYLISKPYVTDWLSEGDFRTAGDAGLYGYWFLVWKRKNSLSHADYLHMARQSYLRWYAKFHGNIGHILFETLENFLPAVKDVPVEFFQKQGALKMVG